MIKKSAPCSVLMVTSDGDSSKPVDEKWHWSNELYYTDGVFYRELKHSQNQYHHYTGECPSTGRPQCTCVNYSVSAQTITAVSTSKTLYLKVLGRSDQLGSSGRKSTAQLDHSILTQKSCKSVFVAELRARWRRARAEHVQLMLVS